MALFLFLANSFWAQASGLFGITGFCYISWRLSRHKRKEHVIMLKQCQDSYHSTFGTYEDMLDYHENQAKQSLDDIPELD